MSSSLKPQPLSHSLWTYDELRSVFECDCVRAPKGYGGVSIDTRSLMPGDLFFALSGVNRNGHDFVEKAFSSGAGAAVVRDQYAEVCSLHGPIFSVKDTQVALENLGRASRMRTHAKIIAVTGSVGKTSTKEMLRLALANPGSKVHASHASYNNHWGVPLSLARMPAEDSFGIFELGMSAPGEISNLTALVQPHVAIVTRIAPAHLSSFPSVEAIADAKGEIFQGVRKGGVAILNRDDPHFDRLRAHACEHSLQAILTYGFAEQSDLRVQDCHVLGDGVFISSRFRDHDLHYKIPCVGPSVALNSLAALLAAYAVGVDLKKAAQRLSTYVPPGGRGGISLHTLPEGGTFSLMDESYNANPVSVAAALETLALHSGGKGRRIAVLGDMLELGEEAHALHAGLLDFIERCDIHVVFAMGPLMKALWDVLPPQRCGAWVATVEELKEQVSSCLRPDDYVMIKGSNSTKISQVVRALKEQYPEVSPFSSESQIS
jgi:UDP-N-acetylmuramoyl-tripeptide--D-alanyl-D-alanine ligase